MEENLLTPDDIVKKTGMKLCTVHNWCSKKKLPAIKKDRRWYVRPEDLEEFLENKKRRRASYNYSQGAAALANSRKRTGQLKKITPELIEHADEICRLRLEVIKQRFPDPPEPGVIRDWIMEYMPVGTAPIGERKGILNY